MQCTVYFFNDELQGTGNLWNLSLDGCRIDGNLSVRCGMRFELLVTLPCERAAIIVQEARVRWTRGQEFGLYIEKLRLNEARRWKRTSGIKSPSLSHTRDLPR